MKNQLQDKKHLPHLRLRYALYPVAKRLRDMRRIRLRTQAFLCAFCVCALAATAVYLFPALSIFASVASLLCVIACLFISYSREKKVELDYLEAARQVESKNASLKQALVTAVQQSLAGKNDFFSTQVANQALSDSSSAHWDRIAKPQATRGILSHLAVLSLLAFSLYACFQANQWSNAHRRQVADTRILPQSITVEPGDTEIERGGSIVITARFEGPLPNDVKLEVQHESGHSQSFPMARSLSDPVFAYSLQEIDSPLSYRIRYSYEQSDLHSISVFERPELVSANASLRFPEYTGWEDRELADTLRLTAIEGTRLTYRFNTNKTVQTAYLENERGERLELPSANEQRTQFLLESTLAQSQAYRLHLEDEAGRSNQFPTEIRIESLPNRRPDLRLSSPRGDQRVSSLEELLFQGQVSDDFGLLDYGIGFSFPGEEPSTLSLASDGSPTPIFEDSLSYHLPLEPLQLHPKDTFSWYLWAADYGPDGKRRLTTGDLYFADVRNFDEIFREQDQGGGSGQGQAGEEGLELLEKQRRIAISLFRIKNNATVTEAETENLNVVQSSQIEAIQELQQMIPQLEEASSIQYAMEAQRFMEGVDVGLNHAIDQPSLDPLELAWSDAQNAYDKLVKLSDDEFNVSRSQNSQQGSGGGASRNQSQLNELDFRQEDSRYETASQAETLTSPDEKKDLELIAKLSELSRRQDDLNDRLQEMQSELALAQTEEERERIERELKRLEEEQRQMLQDADEAIQQAGNRQSTRQVRQQLEQARENMREASQELEEGQVSQALAAGTRARNTLDQSRERMREANSSEFSEALRNARSRAQQLSQSQQRLEDSLNQFSESSQRSLDDSEQRESLASEIEAQAQSLDQLLEQIQEIAEASENVEPGLYRDLYQILRDNNSSRYEERYEQSSLYMRQGFVEEARRGQRGMSENISELSESISQAADSVLGTQTATMQFAQSEIEALNEQLEAERSGESQPQPSNQQSGSNEASGASQDVREQLRNAFSNIDQVQQGPLTGGSFNEWIDRLNTVESLLEEPNVRARVSEARETAESMRRDFKRHGELPQWDLIQNEIAAPLNEVRSWLVDELRRNDNSDTLQAVDRDPVPDEYNEIVRSYYESLGSD
ncbi:hypothetical protein [Pelagicoccus enzymogenes]|uniref:hypothetical protein n=1 Tax=Pelagicoccus enzymogenes TaxID=2773457 RepID=UPI0028114DEA|nr:hypothetical protein [Pelagicoccus enzymogenes]